MTKKLSSEILKDRERFVGFDQYGERYDLGDNPRQSIMEQTGSKSLQKMYVDTKDGKIVHVGYISKGKWITLYILRPYRKEQ